MQLSTDSTCISNKELRSYCNIVSVEQCILALASSLWKKGYKNNDDIINFAHHHQSEKKAKTPLNITVSSSSFSFSWFFSSIFYDIFNSTLYHYLNLNFKAALVTLTCHFIKKYKQNKCIKNTRVSVAHLSE